MSKRDEIVSLHLDEDINPNEITGVHLKPEELKKWYEAGDDFVVLDMRNDYEFAVGRFKNSVNPSLENFRDLRQRGRVQHQLPLGPRGDGGRACALG